MNKPSAYRRAHYFVDTKYQLRFATRVFFALMGIALTSGGIASFLLHETPRQKALQNDGFIVAALYGIGITLLAELLIAIPLIFILSVRQTHRIIGPMGRLKRALQAIGEGDFAQRISVRQGDVLEDLAQAVNHMAENLQRRFS